MTNQEIVQVIVAKFGEEKISSVENYDILHLTIPSSILIELMEYLYQHKVLKFQFLTDLAGLHFPSLLGNELSVVYHLHSLENNKRLFIKVFLPIKNPVIPTLTNLYAAANWMEREAYDFYGIIFEGHPNLKRILNVQEMDYFPLRKEYPLEDATRQDKIDALFGR